MKKIAAILSLAAFISLCDGFHLGSKSHYPLLPYLHPEMGFYEKSIRPNNGGDPVNVELNTFVRGIEKVDYENAALTVQLTFRQSWTDPRLKNNADSKITMRGDEPNEKIWLPDTFIRESMQISTHKLFMTDQYARIANDGSVQTSTRLSATIKCPELANFDKDDIDTISCNLVFASYAYSAADITYKWRDTDPVQKPKLLKADNHLTVDKLETDVGKITTATGTYEIGQLLIILKRND